MGPIVSTMTGIAEANTVTDLVDMSRAPTYFALPAVILPQASTLPSIPNIVAGPVVGSMTSISEADVATDLINMSCVPTS